MTPKEKPRPDLITREERARSHWVWCLNVSTRTKDFVPLFPRKQMRRTICILEYFYVSCLAGTRVFSSGEGPKGLG